MQKKPDEQKTFLTSLWLLVPAQVGCVSMTRSKIGRKHKKKKEERERECVSDEGSDSGMDEYRRD